MAEEKHSWGIIGMTIPECAQALRIHERTLRDMIASRPDFPARKMGKSGKGWRIDVDALKKWLDGRDLDRIEMSEKPDNEQMNLADVQEHLPEVKRLVRIKKKNLLNMDLDGS